jgi:methylated-DNA-[protein]-cysteine S-methyltransferase
MRLERATVSSPIGDLTIVAHAGRVCLLHFGANDASVCRSLARGYPGVPVFADRDPAGAATALARYFDGDLAALDEIEVELNGTPFQQRVWKALRAIRPGTTCSYGDLARRIHAESAIRAVGAANGANPVALVVPCHRVIGSDGSLTGYGGGLHIKRWLLRHEGVLLV